MKSNDALVSVIVPVYGTETYLPACIESICGQSYKNIQIILVDDQSPDRCPEICDDYGRKDPRILVIHQKNTGVSGARNAGMDRAAGEYILFVDSDDELYPEAVETLVRDARDYGADIVWAPQKQIGKDPGAHKEGAYTVYRDAESLLLSLEGAYNINSVCGKLFKSAFIEGLSFEEGKNINEDGFFMFQCYMRRPFFLRHNVAVYQYNTRPGSSSRQVFSDKYLSMLYFSDRKKELVAANCPQYMDQARNMEVRTNLQMLDLLCRTTDRKYRQLQRQCVDRVRRLYPYHIPINDHHKMLAWVVIHGLYPLYKLVYRHKYKSKLS